MSGHSAVHIAALYQITKVESGYQKTKHNLEDDEAAASVSNSTGYRDPLNRQSQDRTDEEEQLTFPQRTHAASTLHSNTY